MERVTFTPPMCCRVRRVLPYCASLPRPRRLSADEAATLAADVGDLPLALYLVGMFFTEHHDHTVQEYVDEMREYALKGEALDISPTNHERDVWKTFAVSYHRLKNAAENSIVLTLLLNMSYFAPNVTIPRDLLRQPTIQAAKHEFDRALKQIGKYGLLAGTPAAPSIHSLIAEFVQRQHTEQERTAAQADVIAAMAAWAQQQNAERRALDPSTFAHLAFVAQIAMGVSSAEAEQVWYEMGRHAYRIGQYEPARTYGAHALEAYRKRYGDAALPTAYAGAEYALALSQAQDLTSRSQSLRLRQSATAVFQQKLGEQHPDSINWLYELAVGYDEVHGDLDSPSKCAKRCFASRKWKPRYSPKTITLWREPIINWVSSHISARIIPRHVGSMNRA
ncbi:hypothetical protein HC928_14530 [bacterium]|nr:hypothetical protein [bacterium]